MPTTLSARNVSHRFGNVVALENVMGREIVQGFLGPALRRKLSHETTNDVEIFLELAELAER